MSLDISNSGDDTRLQQMRDGVAELAQRLSEYPVRVSLHNFASNAPWLLRLREQPLREVFTDR
ncbi:hypothetical protein ACNPNP_10850 [Microbacterium sp. AGC85]